MTADTTPSDRDQTLRLVADVWDLVLARSLGSTDADLGERWDAAYRRVRGSGDLMMQVLAGVDDHDLDDVIRRSGAATDSVDAFLAKAQHDGGVRAYLTNRIRQPPAAEVFGLSDISGECLIAVSEIVAGVATAVELPFLGGTLLAHGVASTAQSC